MSAVGRLPPRSSNLVPPRGIEDLKTPPLWHCVQAGHRERYAIPRALDRAEVLGRLITDLWIPPRSPWSHLLVGQVGRRLRDRYSGDLLSTKVQAPSLQSLAWDAWARLRVWDGSRRVLARNRWWGEVARKLLVQGEPCRGDVVFSYSYDAHAVFGAARAHGLVPVLGQIDPGPQEDRKVAELTRRWPMYRSGFQPGTVEYYESWRRECEWAACIVVNSEWSRQALISAGVEANKIDILPLVYEPPAEARDWRKDYPREFSRARPMRVLFLGQCILRKGIAEVIEAAKILADEPIEFVLVGNTDIANFTSHFGRARIWYHSRVSRAECAAFYRDAHLFLFPTHSDGFGLTQLEAQAWRLPIVASTHCAHVVEPGYTGEVVAEVSGSVLAATLRSLAASPERLALYSGRIRPRRFGLSELGRSLVESLEKRRYDAAQPA